MMRTYLWLHQEDPRPSTHEIDLKPVEQESYSVQNCGLEICSRVQGGIGPKIPAFRHKTDARRE